MKKYFAIASTLLAVALAVPTFAGNTYQAQLRPDFTIMVDNKEANFKTASGEAVYPILYNDSTYLPLRAIGELMGRNVDWNEQTKTITLSGTRQSSSSNTDNPNIGTQSITIEERQDFTIIIDGQKKEFYSATGERIYPVLYNGSTYLPLRSIGEIMNKNVSWDGTNQIVGLTGGSTVTDADSFGQGGTTTPTTPTNPSTTTDIGMDRAKEIALNHAGLSASSVNFVKTRADYDDGRKVYEIEFYVGANEYDYEIDATTGKILDFDYDAESYAPPVSTNPSTTTDIGMGRAKEIALNHAGLNASSVNFVKTKADYDDGRKVYEIEFYVGANEYDYEIDATTGKILDFDYDAESYAPPVSTNPSTTTDIGAEKAKQIALNHAGLSAGSVNFVKAERDYDDGQLVYEIEMRSGRMEYEYKISATNGNILEYESEYDD